MSAAVRVVLVCLAVAGCVETGRDDARPARAKNVILFVGDGMGISTVTAARIFDGQARGETGEENVLAFERFPHVALSKTYSTDAQVSDSASTATALMSGVKTRSYMLGVDDRALVGDCDSVAGASVPTLLELAEDRGLATGIVTTTRITHATPAAAYAHSPHRNWEFDGMVPESEQACADLARQLVEFDHGDGIDVVLGGGRALFLPEGAGGVRKDGRDLITQWRERHTKGRFVANADELMDERSASATPLLGLFATDHLQFDYDRAQTPGSEPSLATMTEQAIRRLSGDADGFFLMVEGGRIDHGHHLGNAHRALSDTVAMADAVAVAVRLTRDDETLIIVTADHSHTLTISGYPKRGSPILGLTGDVDAAGRPYATLSYANGPGAVGESDVQPAGVKRFPHEPTRYSADATVRPDLASADTRDPNFLQEAAIPIDIETHAGEDVAVYARGPGAEGVHGVMEQNLIYDVMRRAYGW